MQTKLQVIVPCFLDPLLCQLYFRNYKKCKDKHVDRLIILTSQHGSTVVHTTYDETSDELYARQKVELKELLRELDISNYILIDHIPPNVEHGLTFNYALQYINDPNYHTLFDEQDSYWINDNFGSVAAQLEHYDIIGGIKTHLPYLDGAENVAKFNKRFGVNHKSENIHVFHLPEFLSNRAIKSLETFCGKAHARYNVRDFAEVPEGENDLFDLDTFQILNCNVCKKTDKVKAHDVDSWDIAYGILHRGPDIDYSEYILYHSFGSRLSAFFGLWNPKLMLSDLTSDNLMDYFHGFFGWDLKCCYHYQSLDFLPNFKHRDVYEKNFHLIEAAYLQYFNRQISVSENGSYSSRNCTKLLQHIL